MAQEPKVVLSVEGLILRANFCTSLGWILVSELASRMACPELVEGSFVEAFALKGRFQSAAQCRSLWGESILCLLFFFAATVTKVGTKSKSALCISPFFRASSALRYGKRSQAFSLIWLLAL